MPWPSWTIVECTGCFVNLWTSVYLAGPLGFPSMYRPPKLRVVQRGRLASSSCVVQPGQPVIWWSLLLKSVSGGTSAGFPLMYPASCSLASSADLFCVRSARIFARSSSWSGTSTSFALSSSSAFLDERFLGVLASSSNLRSGLVRERFHSI